MEHKPISAVASNETADVRTEKYFYQKSTQDPEMCPATVTRHVSMRIQDPPETRVGFVAVQLSIVRESPFSRSTAVCLATDLRGDIRIIYLLATQGLILFPVPVPVPVPQI